MIKHRNYKVGDVMPLAGDSAATIEQKMAGNCPITPKHKPMYDLRRVARRKANTPWPEKVEPLEREEGLRDIFVCKMANSHKADINLRLALERRLCEIAGGFTSTPMQGGWIDPVTKQYMVEAGAVYEISFEPENKVAILRQLRAAFADFGKAIGERWVHMEWKASGFYALHQEVKKG